MRHQSWRTWAAVRVGTVSTSRQYRRLIGAALAAAFCAASVAMAQDGKALFDAKCSVCHNIGGGPKVGPDLKGIVAKRGKDGTVAAVLDPAKAGLKPAMPNLGVPKKDAEAIVAYLDASTAAPAKDTAAASAPAVKEPVAQGTPAEIQLGGDLFEGKVRFANAGPSCNACHHVASDAHLGGGVLASELTLVFSRMGKQGVSAILSGSPFPVMQTAYAGKEFSEKEINALVAFLQHVDKESSRQMPKEWGWRMFSAGAGGVVVLLGIFGLAGRGRKKRCVNQDIYDRQIKSE